MFIEPLGKEQLPPHETSKRFIFGVLLAYTSVVIIGILNHPMWRDEIHPWLMAGASSSVKNLFELKVSEGHPDLWYLLVYVIRAISSDLLILQLIHAGIAIATAFLILKYAPFTRVQRALPSNHHPVNLIPSKTRF